MHISLMENDNLARISWIRVYAGIIIIIILKKSYHDDGRWGEIKQIETVFEKRCTVKKKLIFMWKILFHVATKSIPFKTIPIFTINSHLLSQKHISVEATQLIIKRNVCVCIYQPLRLSRLWHKVNILSGVKQVCIKSCCTIVKGPSVPSYLEIVRGRIVGCIPFARVLAL